MLFTPNYFVHKKSAKNSFGKLILIQNVFPTVDLQNLTNKKTLNISSNIRFSSKTIDSN